MPIFWSAETHTRGKTFAARVAPRSPATSSSSVSVPASKNVSISFSSASATISMRASRACSTLRSHVGWDGAFAERAAFVRLIDERLLRDEVDDAGEQLLFADRQLDRNDRAAADLA